MNASTFDLGAVASLFDAARQLPVAADSPWGSTSNFADYLERAAQPPETPPSANRTATTTDPPAASARDSEASNARSASPIGPAAPGATNDATPLEKGSDPAAADAPPEASPTPSESNEAGASSKEGAESPVPPEALGPAKAGGRGTPRRAAAGQPNGRTPKAVEDAGTAANTLADKRLSDVSAATDSEGFGAPVAVADPELDEALNQAPGQAPGQIALRQAVEPVAVALPPTTPVDAITATTAGAAEQKAESESGESTAEAKPIEAPAASNSTPLGIVQKPRAGARATRAVGPVAVAKADGPRTSNPDERAHPASKALESRRGNDATQDPDPAARSIAPATVELLSRTIERTLGAAPPPAETTGAPLREGEQSSPPPSGKTGPQAAGETAPAGPRRIDSAPAWRGAAENPASAMHAADRARFVQRVSKAMHAAVERGGPIRLRLSPAELGALQLEIRVQDGSMSARLTAESAAAKSLLLESLPDLRERLAQQDIRLERFEVDVRDEGQGRPWNQPDGRHDQDASRRLKAGAPLQPRLTESLTQPVPTAAWAAAGPARIDVVI